LTVVHKLIHCFVLLCLQSGSTTPNQKVIEDIFYSFHESFIECSCGAKSNTNTEKSSILSVPLPDETTSEITLAVLACFFFVFFYAAH